MLSTRLASRADVAAVARLWTAANVARHAEVGLEVAVSDAQRHYVRDL